MTPIYLDYNATTPLDPEVGAAMLPLLTEIYGNPSSVHQVGRRARAWLDEARERVAAVWGVRSAEVVFTSGATEANHLAILGVARRWRDRGRHLITSGIEHPSVLGPCRFLAREEGFELTCLPVSTSGRIDPADLDRAIRPDTVLVTLMAANNEVGVLQDVAGLGEVCQRRGVWFHTDGVQWLGKEPFTGMGQFHADLVSVCAHKFYGPKGAGALMVRSGALPQPLFLGGSQENDRRAGTENLAAIAGLAAASERFLNPAVFPADKLRKLSQALQQAIAALPGTRLWSDPLSGLSNTVAFSVAGCDSLTLLAGLDLEGICASSGSACSAGAVEPSHVIQALGGSREEASSLVRFSLGRETTLAEVTRVAEVLPQVIGRARGWVND